MYVALPILNECELIIMKRHITERHFFKGWNKADISAYL